MGEVRNFKKGAEAAKNAMNAAKNPAAAMGMVKALFNGTNSKISNGSAAIIVTVAFIFDLLALLALIPLVGWIIGPCIYILGLFVFWLWFKLKGVNYFSSRATASKVVTAVLEAIPELSAIIPGVTINAIAAIIFCRIEEAGVPTGNKGEGDTKKESQEATPKNNIREFKRPEPGPNKGQVDGDREIKNKRVSGVELEEAA